MHSYKYLQRFKTNLPQMRPFFSVPNIQVLSENMGSRFQLVDHPPFPPAHHWGLLAMISYICYDLCSCAHHPTRMFQLWRLQALNLRRFIKIGKPGDYQGMMMMIICVCMWVCVCRWSPPGVIGGWGPRDTFFLDMHSAYPYSQFLNTAKLWKAIFKKLIILFVIGHCLFTANLRHLLPFAILIPLISPSLCPSTMRYMSFLPSFP